MQHAGTKQPPSLRNSGGMTDTEREFRVESVYEKECTP